MAKDMEINTKPIRKNKQVNFQRQIIVIFPKFTFILYSVK